MTQQRNKKRYNDDGGAAKGSDRLYRRKRRRIIDIISIPLGFTIVIWLLMQMQYHLNDKMENKRRRNKATLERMKKAFQIKNEDGSGDSVSADDDESHDKRKINGIKTRVAQRAKRRYRWVDERQVPPMRNSHAWFKKYLGDPEEVHRKNDYKIQYRNKRLDWETLAEEAGDKPPIVDYTEIDYEYPKVIPFPPRGEAGHKGGPYPPLEPMETLFERWPQEDIDSPPNPFEEKLQHFNFNNPKHMEAAIRYRDLEFPFKVYNIPEIDEAGDKWTDEYLSYHFDRFSGSVRGKYGVKQAEEIFGANPPSSGRAQHSIDSFFAFFIARNWSVEKMGPPPTKDTDLTFAKWAKHARYADAVGLEPNQVHYYYQSGVPPNEKEQAKSTWTMISADLPSFSVTEPNFFSFHPEEQKGIQCRFGERVCYCCFFS